MSRVVGLFGEEHVVLAELAGIGIGIFGRRFVPESELAFGAQDVGAEDAAIVGESGHRVQIILRHVIKTIRRRKALTTKGTKVHEGKI